MLNAGEVFATAGIRYNPAGAAAFDRDMKRSAKSMDGFDKAHAKTQKQMVSTGQVIGKASKVGFLAFGAAAAYGVKQAAEFESALNSFKAVSGATSSQMDKVSKKAKALGADMSLPGTSAKDAAESMTELVKGGLSVSDAMDAAKGSILLANAAQISNSEAAKITADNLNAFGLAGKDASRVADLLAASANATTAEMPEMAESLKQSAAVAKQLGIPIEDTVTAIGELANAGIKGSDAGTSLKTMLLGLTPNSKKAAETMKQLGVDAFNSQGKFVGMKDLIGQYSKALDGLTQEQRQEKLKAIFGQDAIRASNIILGQSVSKFDALKNKVTESGQAAQLGQAKMKGFNGMVEGLKSVLQTAAISFGEGFLPALTAAGKGFGDLISKIDSSGGFEEFGRRAGEVASMTIQAFQMIAQGAAVVVGPIAQIANTIGLLNPSVIFAVGAAFAGWKLGTFVSSLSAVSTAGRILTGVGTAAMSGRAGIAALAGVMRGQLAAAFAALAANPVAVVLAGVGVAAAALISRHQAAAKAAEQAAAAEKAYADAIERASDAALASANAEFAQITAKKNLETSEHKLQAMRKQGKQGTKEYSDELQNHKEAALRYSQATQEAEKSQKEFNQTQAEMEDKAAEQYEKTTEAAKKNKASQDDVTKAYEKMRNAAGESIVNIVNNQRALKGQVAVFGKARTSMVKFARNLRDSGFSRTQAVKIVAKDAEAKGRISKLSAKLQALGKINTVTKILAETGNSESIIKKLKAEINSIPSSKTVSVSVTQSVTKAIKLVEKKIKAKSVGDVEMLGGETSGDGVVSTLGAKVSKKKQAQLGALSTEALENQKSGLETDISDLAGLKDSSDKGDRKKFRKEGGQRKLNKLRKTHKRVSVQLALAKRYEAKDTARSELTDIASSKQDLAAMTGDKTDFEAQRTAQQEQINLRIKSTERALKLLKGSKKKGKRGRELQKRLEELKIAQKEVANETFDVTASKDFQDKKKALEGQGAEVSLALTQADGVLGKQITAQADMVSVQEKLVALAQETGDASEIAAAQQALVQAEQELAQLKKQQQENEVALAEARAEATGTLTDDIAAAELRVALQEDLLEIANATGDEGKIAEALSALTAAQTKLRELKLQAEENAAELAVARAALTVSLDDDVTAAEQMVSLRESALSIMEATGDESMIASAKGALKSAQDALDAAEQTAALLPLERDKALAALTATIDDDRAIQLEFIDYYQTALEAAKASGDAQKIKDAAEALKSAQSESIAQADAVREEVLKYFDFRKNLQSQASNAVATTAGKQVGEVNLYNYFQAQPADPAAYAASTAFLLQNELS